MRNEQEMLALIVGAAEKDQRVRAAMLNGSRADPSARGDIFQDYDVTYVVTEVESFKSDPAWIEQFGELLIMQLPEAMEDPPPMNDGHFAYLMQFADGNRIDLTLFPLAKLGAFQAESLSQMLLDKDNLFGQLPAPSDRDYRPQPPSAKRFADCCNEFWWVSLYVGKGLWRGEITYAKYMLDTVIREQLMKMLDWHVGIKTQFSAGGGKYGKRLEQRLEPALWDMLLQTYSDADYERTWAALHTMGDLFRLTAGGVAAHFGFDYPRRDDERASAHLKHVQALPRDAKEIY